MTCWHWSGAAVVFGLASVVHAGFEVNVFKMDSGATDIVSIYAYNNGLNNSGTRLEAIEFGYSGTPTRFPFNQSVDVWNGNDESSYSWVRCHPDLVDPFHLIPRGSSPAWASPIGSFTITYATLALDPMPANVQPGYQVARLVLPDGGSFSLNLKAGGETGAAFEQTVVRNYFEPNIPPVIQPVGGSGGGLEAATVQIQAIDEDGLIQSYIVNDLDFAASRGVTWSLAGDVYSFDTSNALPGTYRMQLTARDSSIQSNSTTSQVFSLVVLPEPTTLSLVAGACTVLLRRIRVR
jgi:hypothetical protein